MTQADVWTSCGIVLTALACVGLLSGMALAQDGPMMKVLADTIVTPTGHTFPDGKWGTAINGQTFQQEALVSFNGYQYAAFFEAPGVLCVARRKLGESAWQVIRFDDYQIKDHRDVHNVAVIGIAHDDGTIHLSYDHHGHPLHYRRSKPGLATHPESADWSAQSFGPTVSELEAGKPIAGVTYPMFFNRPDGQLQLIFRVGSSGDGDWMLAEYDGASGAWQVLGTIFSREGVYETSRSRCAYPNPIRYGPGNRLHITWCWRERPAGVPLTLRTNHDILYAYSDDFGRTWKNNDGAEIARLGESTIGVNTPGIIAAPTKFMHGQMNQLTQYVDSKGRVHVISWHQPPEGEPTTDVNSWRYYAYHRDELGKWHERQLPFVGRKPQIVVDEAGNAFVIHTRNDDRRYHQRDPGGTLTISRATEAGGWADWHDVYTAPWTGIGEPLVDVVRWKAEGVLSVYLQEKPAEPGKPSPLHVIDLKP